jgi:hypothetical protein
MGDFSKHTVLHKREPNLEAITSLGVEDKAYIAGFFDGEGSLGVYPKLNGALTIRITIAQRTPEVLEWIQGIFGGTLTKIERTDKRNMRENSGHVLLIEKRDRIRMILERIAPYVRQKKDQVDMVLDLLRGKEVENIVVLMADAKRRA